MVTKRKKQFLRKFICLVLLLLAGRVGAASQPQPRQRLTGYTLHFDFFNDWHEARRLMAFTRAAGATVLNVVPPPHIWENGRDLDILRRIFCLSRSWDMAVLLSRIDASASASDPEQRDNWLYARILDQRGRLPSGKSTPDFFRATVGNHPYEEWLRQETAYYADHFSAEPNLLGFSIGPFNEPFVSQRGSLLCYDFSSEAYEFAQYTPAGRFWWRSWLRGKFGDDIRAINSRYGTAFADFDAVPMPLSDHDPFFGRALVAYWDLACAMNDWMVRQYRDCLAIWKEHARRSVPFIWQFSGFVPEKLALGRPALAALDIFDWMQAGEALGLSLYTNAGYPDWGHASDAAMVNFLQLGRLQHKPILVMEGGNEDDGPVYRSEELAVFAGAARPLQPAAQIYEFLRTPYDAAFAHHDGDIIDRDWRIDHRTRRAVIVALEKARHEAPTAPLTYVLAEPRALSLENDDLQIHHRLLAAALEKPLAFVPRQSLTLLPADSTLLVIPVESLAALSRQLADKKIRVISARDWLR